MQWDKDPFKIEKYMIFDAIIAFAKINKGKDFNDISLKDLIDFINNFCDTHLFIQEK